LLSPAGGGASYAGPGPPQAPVPPPLIGGGRPELITLNSIKSI